MLKVAKNIHDSNYTMSSIPKRKLSFKKDIKKVLPDVSYREWHALATRGAVEDRFWREIRKAEAKKKKKQKKVRFAEPPTASQSSLNSERTYRMLQQYTQRAAPRANVQGKSINQLLKILKRKEPRTLSVTIYYTASNVKYLYYDGTNEASGEIHEIKGQKTTTTSKELLNNGVFVSSVIVDDIRSRVKKNMTHVSSVGKLEYSTVMSEPTEYRKIRYRGTLHKRIPLKSKLFEGVNLIKDVNNGYCVPEAIYNQLEGQDRYKRTTKKDIYEQFNHVTQGKLSEGVSIEDIEEWQHKYGKYVNIYVLNGLQKIIRLYAPDRDHANCNVCLQLTNGHCTGIDNETIKHDIARKDKVELFKIDFETRAANYTMYDESMRDALIRGEINENVVLDEGHDITASMNEIMATHQYLIEQFMFRSQSNISAFIHPSTGKMVIENNDFELRKAICAKAFDIYKADEFSFTNQSITQIASSLFKYTIGKLQKSSYSQTMLNVIDEFSPKPICKGYLERFSDENSCGFDIYKDYSAVLYHNEKNIPVNNVLCDLQDYDGREIVCGEYLIDNVEFSQFAGSIPFVLYAGLYSWNLIKGLVENGLMDKSHIKKMIIPCGEIPAESLKQFVEFVYSNFTEEEGKKIVNMWIGNMGSKYNKEIKGCILDSEVEARSLQALYENIEVFPFNNLFLVKQNCKERLIEDNTSINRFVVSGGILKVIETMQKVMNEKSKLIAIRTDCVYVENPIAIQAEVKKSPIFVKHAEAPTIDENDFVHTDAPLLNNLGKMKIEKKINPVGIINDVIDGFDPLETLRELAKEEIVGKGVQYDGIAGSGKTYKATQTFLNEQGENKVMVSFTNKACNVVRKRMKDKELEADFIFTLSKFMNDDKVNVNKLVEKISKLNVLWVDETSMCPMKFYKIIYLGWLRSKGKLKVILSGDINQIQSIEEHGEKRYDVTKCRAIRQMCPTLTHLDYIVGCGRYDDKAHKMIEHFLKEKNLNGFHFAPLTNTEFNICYYNKTRQWVNKQCDAQHEGRTITFKYQKKPEQYKVYEGMRLMCTANLDKREMYNSEMYTLDKIAEGCYQINEQTFTEEELAENFIVAYCVTTHKFQGDEINTHYNIWDVQKMNANELNTALSRTTKYEYIHLDTQRLAGQYNFYDYTTEKNKIYTPAKGGIYGDSKIYEVTTSDGMKYVGSTTGTIENRLEEHLKDKSSPLCGQKNCAIVELTKCLCFSRKELEEIECKYIQQACEKYGKERMLNTKMVKKDEKKKLEPKLEIKKEIKNKYTISNAKDSKGCYYYIKWVENGKQQQIKRRFRQENEEAVYESIKKEQEKLIEKNNSVAVGKIIISI